MVKKILFLSFYLLSHGVMAQKTAKIQLLNADVLEYDEQLGGKVKRLKGNVAFKHEKITMYCDSAYLYSETNILEAFSNVHIKEGDNLNVYGDFLKYDGNVKKAELHGNAKLIHRNMTLTTENLTQDIGNNISSYYDGGEIIDADNQLFSKIGFYYPNSSEFFFKDSVVLINPEYTMNSDTLKYNTQTEISYFFGPTTIISKENFIYCENGWYDTKSDISQFNKNASLVSNEQSIRGDSLFYDRGKGYGEAFGNVVVHDTVQDIIISGDYLEYFEKENIAMVTKNAMLTDIFDDDSLFMHADTFKTGFDSTGDHRMLYAYNQVKFFRPDLQGLCDSIIYTYKDSTIQLYTDPVLWSEENQMTADYIEMQTDSGGIKSLTFDHNAFIVSFVDSGRYNQIKGKDMVAYFNDNELNSIEVIGNGQTIYYAQEEDSSYIGVNKTDCSNMLIYIKENAIDKMTFITKPDATLYPIDELQSDEVILKGFKWLEDKRPLDKEDIFVWR